jgi:hypothetical protein
MGPGGEWEIGVVPAKDGPGYDLLLDTYGSPGARLSGPAGGPQLNGIRREYAAAVAEKKALEKLSRHGWRVQREDLPGNLIRLKVRKR